MAVQDDREQTREPEPTSRESSERKSRERRNLARASSAGIQLVVSICLGFFGGQWLDGRLDTSPMLTIAGLILGLVAGFRDLYQMAKESETD